MQQAGDETVTYLRPFLEAYYILPSMAIIRSVEARLLSSVALKTPILDLGCGDGLFALTALRRVLEAGCDLDPEKVKAARKRGAYHAVLVADARSLPYGNDSFNTVLSNCTLEHIPDVDSVFREVARVTRAKGRLIFTVPSEKFDEFNFYYWLLNNVGLTTWARTWMDRYNVVQGHYHIDAPTTWKRKLRRAGFIAERITYYLPFRSSLVWSAFDALNKGPQLLSCSGGTQGPRGPTVGQAMPWLGRIYELVFPRVIGLPLLERALRWAHMADADEKAGSGLFVIAQKRK